MVGPSRSAPVGSPVVLVLLPPSETKWAGPRRGTPVRLEGLTHPQLTAAREFVLDHLIEVSRWPDAPTVLGAGASLASVVADNTGLRTRPDRAGRSDLHRRPLRRPRPAQPARVGRPPGADRLGAVGRTHPARPDPRLPVVDGHRSARGRCAGRILAPAPDRGAAADRGGGRLPIEHVRGRLGAGRRDRGSDGSGPGAVRREGRLPCRQAHPWTGRPASADPCRSAAADGRRPPRRGRRSISRSGCSTRSGPVPAGPSRSKRDSSAATRLPPCAP